MASVHYSVERVSHSLTQVHSLSAAATARIALLCLSILQLLHHHHLVNGLQESVCACECLSIVHCLCLFVLHCLTSLPTDRRLLIDNWLTSLVITTSTSTATSTTTKLDHHRSSSLSASALSVPVLNFLLSSLQHVHLHHHYKCWSILIFALGLLYARSPAHSRAVKPL